MSVHFKLRNNITHQHFLAIQPSELLTIPCMTAHLHCKCARHFPRRYGGPHLVAFCGMQNKMCFSRHACIKRHAAMYYGPFVTWPKNSGYEPLEWQCSVTNELQHNNYYEARGSFTDDSWCFQKLPWGSFACQKDVHLPVPCQEFHNALVWCPCRLNKKSSHVFLQPEHWRLHFCSFENEQYTVIELSIFMWCAQWCSDLHLKKRWIYTW